MPEEIPPSQKWLSIADAAVHTGKSVDALSKAVQRGRLVPDAPARKGLSRGHRFLRETLDAYMTGESLRAAG